MSILIVTNRVLNPASSKPEERFGETPNRKGPCEIRLANVSKNGAGKWQVDVVPENRGMSVDNVPSRTEFMDLRDRLIKENRNCVFYVHGYNKTFKESLEQSWEIHEHYGVEVIGFSWPSDPAGITGLDYRKAQRVAEISAPALDCIFEKMGRYFRECWIRDPGGSERCRSSFNLVIHSLGNYLFRNFIESAGFTGETRFFDNIVLQQADVDNPSHQTWVNKLRFAKRIYVTINERDVVLAASDVINRDRLGNTARNLVADRPIYVDFTGADEVGKDHRIYFQAIANDRVKDFFSLAFNGKRAERLEGIQYVPEENVHVFQPDRKVLADVDEGGDD